MLVISRYIDAALLSPTSTPEQVRKFCKEAKKYKFWGADALPCYTSLVAKELKGRVKVIAVVGYPLGLNTTADKVFETKEAIRNGADEIDMVMNIGWFKAKQYSNVLKDIRAVVKAAKGHTVKVIIETGYLRDAEIMKASRLVKKSGANFVKTCSGYGPRGVTVKDIKLIKKAVGKFNIKASGGIRTAKQAISLIEAGATRIGTSAGKKIVHELEN